MAACLSRTSNASSVTISSAFALKFQKVKKRFLVIKPHRKLSTVRILERASYFAYVANSSYFQGKSLWNYRKRTRDLLASHARCLHFPCTISTCHTGHVTFFTYKQLTAENPTLLRVPDKVLRQGAD